MEYESREQILEESNALGKGINLFILPPAMGK